MSNTLVAELVNNIINNIINKCIIINIFNNTIKGTKFNNIKGTNKKHDGKEGHFLEKKFGLKPNCNNRPDILGFEMKNQTKSKTTFVDKVPSNKYYKGVSFNIKDTETKKIFWNTFKRQYSKGIRIGGWNLNEYDKDGQCLYVDDNKNIKVLYQYKYDKRPNKNELIDNYYKNDEIHIIMEWVNKDIQEIFNNKWNQGGFFVCKKDKKNIYNKICFGKPESFEYWLEHIKQKNICFEGYSNLDGKWRGCFRASNKWFYSHITEEY